jgi:hypothetical protein
MPLSLLTAVPRSNATGSLAQARAVGLLPLTITDVRAKKRTTHAATLRYDAFAQAWQQRTVHHEWAIDGLTEPLTVAVTAFNYCPVSHTVIHVLAVAYTADQRSTVPIVGTVDGATLRFPAPIICRGTRPAVLTADAPIVNGVLRYRDFFTPTGVTVAAFTHDRVDTPAGAVVFEDFWRRPGH